MEMDTMKDTKKFEYPALEILAFGPADMVVTSLGELIPDENEGPLVPPRGTN